MTTGIGARSNQDRDIQVVAVTAVNIPERKAECMTRIRSMIYVDTSYPVGGVYITPSVGDQWYVERIDTIWRLFGRIPFNDNNIQVDPVEGQQVFGGTGPVVMNGSTLDIRSPLQMNPVPDDEMPNAADMPPGTIIYSESLGLVVSDGTGEWVPTGGAGDIEDIEGLTELLDNKIDKPLVPLVPGTGTKISYDENGLVIGSDDADITDITDLDTTLEGKSDVGHIHDETEITNLVYDLAGKAAVDHVHSEDGEALDPDLIDIGALTPANFDFIQRIADHWTNVPPSEVKGGLDLSFLDIGGICDLLQIPSLPANWITSGTFLNGLIPQIDVTKIIGGPFTIDMIPKLATNWITGIFSPTQIPSLTPGHIPDLSADKITSGILDLLHIPAMDLGRIPNLPASQITTGVLNLLRIPGLDLTRIPELPAGQITSGTFLDTLIPNLAASKITSGVLNLLRIPNLPAGQITSGTFPQSMLDILNIPAGIISGILGGTQIPQLDVTKIIGGPFTIDMIPGLPAGQITSGTFPQSMLDILNIPAGIISGILGGTHIPQLDVTKIIGGPFDLGMIPGLPAGQITSGTFPQSMLDILNIPAGIISGILGGAHIPQLDVTKIIGGPFDTGMIPGLPADQITSGTFPQAMLDITNIPASIVNGLLGLTNIPPLPAGRITSGTFPQAMLDITNIASSIVSGSFLSSQIPQIDVTKIIGGPFDTGMIPGLPAGKITSGYFPQSMITGLDTALAGTSQALNDAICNAMGIPGTGHTTAEAKAALLNIPGVNIVSQILAGIIPQIDVTKIIGGPFTTDMIPSLDANKITAGVLNLLRIPGLDVSRIPNLPAGQITSGTFPQAMLDITNIASSIVSGAFLSSQIPLLDVTKIIGGPFDTGMIPSLNASKITAGVLDLLRIPGLDVGRIPNLPAGQITSGTFPQTMLDITNIASSIVSGSFLASQIPSLDVTKIIGGPFTAGMIPDLSASKITAGVLDLLRIPGLDVSRIPNLPAGQITSGTFPQSMLTITSIASSIVSGSFLASQIPSLDVTKIIGGPFTAGMIPDLNAAKITTGILDLLRIPGLDSSRIPDLNADKITQGVLNLLRIPGLDVGRIPSLPAGQITSGTFLGGLIPQLDVTKIIGGPFDTGMIPGLPASQITSGTFGAGLIPILDAATKLSGILGLGQIPELPADQITSGVLGTSLIPGLPADRITSGFLDLLRIPDLPADQITSGIFPQSMLGITNIAADLISGIIGLTQIPDLNASKITGGEFNPLRIPGLPASKIDSGVFGLGRIPLLDLTKIPLLDLTKIPNLPANWITGTFVTGQIPDLSADKITSGIMDLFRLPTFPTTKISGTFPQTMIDNLTTNLGSIFTTITSPTRADLLQNVPLGSIGQFNPELLTNPSYTNALSVFGGSTNWSWDPAVTRTVGGTGSAKVVADGVNSQLLSDPPIPVSPNQVLSVSHWLRWSGVTVIPGVAFRLSVTAYLGIGVSNTVDIQTIVTPAASSGWVQLSGQYTVPATGVDNIRLQLSVTSLVTAGQIWWDDGSVKKVQLLRQDWTSALVGDLNNLFTGIGARLLITDHTDLMSALGLGDTSLTAITNRLANLGSGGLFNAANLSNILGIPMVSNTRVSGIGGALHIGTSMQETWNAVGGTALASLGDITSRLANLGSGGLFNASGLSNLLGIPTGKLPNAIIPALDGTLIQFGQVPIAQIPTNLFGRSNITDLQGVIDGLTNQMGFLNTVITGGSQANANKSLKSIFSTLLQTGQSTQRVLQEVQGDKYSGMSGFFNFGSVPSNASGLPSEIVTTYNGAGTSKLVVANGAAHWDLVPNGNRSAICRYSPRPTVTDGQFVGVTLPTYPGYGGGVSAANYTFARLNSTGTDFVYLKVTADAAMNYFAELGYAVGGSRTIWVPATLFQTDANVWLAAGTDGGLRQYQVLIGNTPLITYSEVGTASAMDANHRWWGFGGDVVGSGTVAPGDVNYISIADHRRPSITTNGFGVGSFFRIYRANTGLVNRPNGYNPLPSNFFDSVEQITPDFVFNSLTGELTIGYEGTYFVNMRFVINFMPDNARTDALLYQNGVLIRRGFGTFSEAGGLAGANQPTGMGGGFVVYCKAGDVLRSGVYCSTTMNSFLNGNPSGNDCYWEVGLLNRSLA